MSASEGRGGRRGRDTAQGAKLEPDTGEVFRWPGNVVPAAAIVAPQVRPTPQALNPNGGGTSGVQATGGGRNGRRRRGRSRRPRARPARPAARGRPLIGTTATRRALQNRQPHTAPRAAAESVARAWKRACRQPSARRLQGTKLRRPGACGRLPRRSWVRGEATVCCGCPSSASLDRRSWRSPKVGGVCR